MNAPSPHRLPSARELRNRKLQIRRRPQPQATPPADSPAAKSRSRACDASPPQKPDQASNPPEDAAATITKTVNEVNVVFTVTDRHGRYVKKSDQERFLGARR